MCIERKNYMQLHRFTTGQNVCQRIVVTEPTHEISMPLFVYSVFSVRSYDCVRGVHVFVRYLLNKIIFVLSTDNKQISTVESGCCCYRSFCCIVGLCSHFVQYLTDLFADKIESIRQFKKKKKPIRHNRS